MESELVLLCNSSPLLKSIPQSCGFTRWIFLGVSAISANVSNVEICLLSVPLLETVYFTPANLEILNFKPRRQHFKLRNLVLFYVWEDAKVRAH